MDGSIKLGAEGADEVTASRPFPRFEAWLGRQGRYELTRFVILRLLGFVYTAAFVSLVWQVVPLIGARGITPARVHVESLLAQAGSPWPAAMYEPSLFLWLTPSDGALLGLAVLGLVGSVALLLGATNAALMLVLWLLYRSFVAVGQVWYGYGWELLLLEAGFLAIFSCPLTTIGAFPRHRMPLGLVWLYRWLAFRVMLGAGLIKLRGDSCWRDLTCLDYHFETQPLPNPLSPLFHALPHWMHAGGVLFNHFAELILPFCLLLPRKPRALAGLGMIVFQLVLIASGNLSFLNWLTIVPLLASFDDDLLARVLPKRLLLSSLRAEPATGRHVVTVAVLSALIALLSISPVYNMFSRRQQMNAAFDSLMLVNSYGAFGSVGRERRELIIEGTRDLDPGPHARWQAYELPFKPGDPKRASPVVSPLQPRLDWQLWFAAMASAEDEPWLLHVVWQLLHAEPQVRKLFAYDPFGDEPPRFVRIMRYRYHLAPPFAEQTWTRELEGYWLPPLPADEILRDAMRQLGYATD
ncbi:MAG: rane protein [Myxococcaceae bacterium]|nr:rane protein [Myxococcaceae bacterium]